MSATGKRRFKSVVEQAIASKAKIKPVTARTFRTDAAAILEALLGEFDEDIVLIAMDHQGFEAMAYRSTIETLAKIAKYRRTQRKPGS